MNEHLDSDISINEDQILAFESLLIAPHIFKSMQWLLLTNTWHHHSDEVEFLQHLTKLPQWLSILQSLPHHKYQFSNHLEQWLSAYDKYPVPLDERLVSVCDNPSVVGYPSVSSLLCLFLIELNHRLTSEQYKRKHYQDSFECNQNHLEYTNYINGLFDCYSKLVVLRIDLSYRKEIAESKTFEDIRNDLDRMRNNARRNGKLFKGLEGYIFKIEYGLDKKIHAHVLLFFNGHVRKPSSDVHHAKDIAKYWEEVITEGDGFAWNCNANKENYRYNGIGLVRANDFEKRTYLISAMKYLCKKDKQAIKPRDKPQTKTLTKGDLRNHNPNLGRPRQCVDMFNDGRDALSK